MKAIAAMASNRVIGKDGNLPWRIKGDLKFFKKMTTDCICVVGRKTFDSLPLLQNRKFVVMSASKKYDLHNPKNNPNGNEVCGQCFDPERNHFPVYSGRDDAWVIGGASIYTALLQRCTDLYLTRIFKPYEGDTFFPDFEHLFDMKDIIEGTDEYGIVHYTRKKT